MNENNKSFYPLDMFEFIHYPEYGCRDLKGLMWTSLLQNYWKLDGLLGSNLNSVFIIMSELEFFLLTRILAQNFNTMDLVKFLETNQKLHI
jgi:hypothetical protein